MNILKLIKLFKWNYHVERKIDYKFLFWCKDRTNNVYGYYDVEKNKWLVLIDNYPLKGNTHSNKLVLSMKI